MTISDTPPAFLGVERSILGRRWIGPSPEVERRAEGLAQRADLPLPLGRVLAARGVAADEVAAFLDPRLRDLLPDPRGLHDMEKAARRVVEAAERREKIAIFADYDVDGGASAALLLAWLRALGHDATLYVPDRITEGYGPNAPAMRLLAQEHALIVCVDCGILAHEALAAAAGADVVVLDHHLAEAELPPALAVVNPNRLDEDGTLGHLCAAGVVFLLLVEANRQLRAKGDAGPDLLSLLDLVALATVADVAPLVGVNRAFVRQGLKVMAARGRPGLRALADVAGLAAPPGVSAVGFALAPRINAGGRIGASDLGARLLAATDGGEADRLAAMLDRLNAERREMTERICDEALARIAARDDAGPVAWAAGEGWHAGVVGIVAARVKEATGRPAIIIGLDGDTGRGSGRSVAGVDLGTAVQRLAAEGLIVQGGGHHMAAGLTVRKEQIPAAMARLAELVARAGVDAEAARRLHVDGILLAEAAGLSLAKEIARAGPFGAAAPAPRFVIPEAVVTARRIGANHLRLRLIGGAGGGIEAIAFGAFDTPLGPALAEAGHRPVHLAGRLVINSWRGREKPELRLDDAAFA